jgi:hypothetical protein
LTTGVESSDAGILVLVMIKRTAEEKYLNQGGWMDSVQTSVSSRSSAASQLINVFENKSME